MYFRLKAHVINTSARSVFDLIARFGFDRVLSLSQFRRTNQFLDLKDTWQNQVYLLISAISTSDAFAICLAIWVDY